MSADAGAWYADIAARYREIARDTNGPAGKMRRDLNNAEADKYDALAQQMRAAFPTNQTGA